MSERLNKVHLIISLIAAIVVAIGFILIHVYGVTHGWFLATMWVNIAIILFYLIGHVARAFLITKVFVMPDEDESDYDEDAFEDIETDDEIMVSVDMEEPGDSMIHAPDFDGDIDGLNGNDLADESMIEETQLDYE